MTAEPSLGIRTFGTDDVAIAPRQLTAGPITAAFDNGSIRHVKYAGIEVLRGISFLVRDVNWGTYGPVITDLQIVEQDGGFRISYSGRCVDVRQAVHYRADITGIADGTLSFSVEGTAETDFATNRLGFVVLHPLVGVAGQPLTVTHTDASTEDTRFPDAISPSQPVFDIRALAHQVCPGVTATCTLLGDTYEMEDQRNWTDASYKTYVRPLSRPLPYTVAANDPIRQSITLQFTGQPESAINTGGNQAIVVSIGAVSANPMPRIGLAVDHRTAAQTLAVAGRIADAGVQSLVCQLDLRDGDLTAVTDYAALAGHLGADVMLELIVPDDADPAAAAANAAEVAKSAGLKPEAVIVSPAAYLMSYQPDAVWPDLPTLDAYYDGVRAAFPGVAVGGGMLSYFTELNRKRPPARAIEFVTHTTCPIVHDADDRAVMESLEAIQYVIATTREFMGELPYRIGPSTIGMRQNPYGEAPAANANNARVAMATADPRHRGLFAAAWSVGYAAEMVRGGIGVVTLAAAIGPRGIIHIADDDTAVPYYDDPGHDGMVYPLYHVIRGLAAAAGAPARTVQISDRTRIQGFAFDTPHGVELWLANLHPEPAVVELTGLAGQFTSHRLDAATFVAATANAQPFWQQPETRTSATLHLDAYAIERIVATT